ncbi:TetR/AcrR family transcriptional regulator [Nocardia vaccinii]|uniref:TetR/AcrR family transcriptional regulator n=1 Tax=Nocardia vaccinii TaxID=1822 RepID=UPI00082DA904|nr:TetR/AcrR family transcriptional regulator [Nocardia vaccinii]
MPATPTPRRAASVATPRRRKVDSARRDNLLARIEDIFLVEGFMSVTMAELTERLHCSKATLYSVASTKEQIVVLATKNFFGSSAASIEQDVSAVDDPRDRITTYLGGVAKAMRRNSRAFYADMMAFEPTAEIYRRNTDRAARRVRELIDDGIESGVFGARDGAFAAQLVALAIDAVQSGALLDKTGLSAADAFAELAQLLLNGLLRQPPPGPLPGV